MWRGKCVKVCVHICVCLLASSSLRRADQSYSHVSSHLGRRYMSVPTGPWVPLAAVKFTLPTLFLRAEFCMGTCCLALPPSSSLSGLLHSDAMGNSCQMQAVLCYSYSCLATLKTLIFNKNTNQTFLPLPLPLHPPSIPPPRSEVWLLAVLSPLPTAFCSSSSLSSSLVGRCRPCWTIWTPRTSEVWDSCTSGEPA